MREIAFLILLVSFLITIVGGCEANNTNHGRYTPENYRRIYTTKVISDPPGARIELDGDYIGDAPLEIRWEGWSANRVFYKDHTLRALPIHEGQYVQSKFFRNGVFEPRDQIPKTILFVMNLSEAPKRYEIDIE
jgi:hypothetical protein